MATHIVKLSRNYSADNARHLPKEVWLECTVGEHYANYVKNDGCIVYIDGVSIVVTTFRYYKGLAGTIIKKVGGKK